MECLDTSHVNGIHASVRAVEESANSLHERVHEIEGFLADLGEKMFTPVIKGDLVGDGTLLTAPEGDENNSQAIDQNGVGSPDGWGSCFITQ